MEIKEIKEAIKGIELLACTGAKIMSDGKIDTSDFGSIINLLTQAGILVEAIKGIKEIPEEIKDIDQAELIELGTELYQLVIKIKLAFESGK